jgi:hypothetical protein
MNGILCNLDDRSPRAEHWQFVFNRLIDIPLVSFFPVRITIPEIGERYAYFLDLNRLTPDEYNRLVLNISKRFNSQVEEVRTELAVMGCPIPVEEVTVTIPQCTYTERSAPGRLL